jgi:hypothetical protein
MIAPWKLVRRIGLWACCLSLGAPTLVGSPGAVASMQEVDETLIVGPASPLRPPPPIEETEIGVSRPAPPTLPSADVVPPPARAVAGPTSTGRPLRITPCFTSEEFNRAALGTGCDCTCNEYARLSAKVPAEQRRCSVVCGVAYYRCWAPQPTDAEISAAARDMGEAGPAMLAQPDGRGFMASGIMMQRALAWEEAQRCPVR